MEMFRTELLRNVFSYVTVHITNLKLHLHLQGIFIHSFIHSVIYYAIGP